MCRGEKGYEKDWLKCLVSWRVKIGIFSVGVEKEVNGYYEFVFIWIRVYFFFLW